MEDVIFDIELYPNYFLCCTYNVVTKERKAFEISPYADDRKALLKYIENKRLIGYNSVEYDGKLLVKLFNNFNLRGRELLPILKSFSDKLISHDKNWAKFQPKLTSIAMIDLLKINHFDNTAKMTSLKDLEFALHMTNIQNLPIHHNKVLSKDEMIVVREYCWNDIDATHRFYLECLDKIKFRERMSKMYGLNFSNFNDVKIGEYILLDAVSKGMDLEPDMIKKFRTYRDEMKMEDIILPYIIFRSEELNTFLEWWKQKTIRDTRGEFNLISLDECQEILPYCNNTLKKGMLANLNIIYKGFQFDFGTGGIHGIIGSGVWREDEKYELILVDVSSYYPNLAEKNKFHPKHIPVYIFVKVIAALYAQRMNAKEINDNEVVAAIKLALNGALYGKSNSEYSFMYDPMFMMKICVNGQLLLVSLAEKLLDTGMEVIQINTDGILIRLKRNMRSTLDNLCEQWMTMTDLKLDYDHFSIVVQKDVNNYLAQYTNGKIKRKGAAFAWDKNNELEWYKNHSALVVKKAVQAYFLEGQDPMQFLLFTLEDPSNIFDFFLRVKIKKRDKLIARSEEGDEEIQRVTRYLVVNEGVTLMKIMPPLPKKPDVIRENNVEAGYQCKVLNNIKDVNLEDLVSEVNLEYYLKQIYKTIKAIENESER